MPPLLGSIGSDPAKAYGFTSVTLPPTFYMAYYGTSNATSMYFAYPDSGGAMYGVGYNSTAARPYLWKTNNSGTLAWQRSYNVANYRGTSVYYDGSSLWVGFFGVLYKVDISTGNAVFAGSVTNLGFSYAIYVSGSSLYVWGTYTGVGVAAVAKLDVSSNLNTLSFIYSYATSSPSTTSSVFYSGAVDSSGNIICVGQTGSSGVIMKLPPSSSTATWTSNHTVAGQTNFIYNGCCVDSSGNIYAAGYYITSTEGYQGLVVKLNSSGTILWSKIFSGTGTSSEQLQSIAIDPSGAYLYVLGSVTTTDILVAKIDTSGNLSFQRTITPGGTVNAQSIQVDSTSMYIGARITRSVTQNYVARLPNDGTKTGTYNLGGTNVTYATSSVTYGNSATITVSTSAFAAVGSGTGATNVTTALTDPSYATYQNITIP